MLEVLRDTHLGTNMFSWMIVHLGPKPNSLFISRTLTVAKFQGPANCRLVTVGNSFQFKSFYCVMHVSYTALENHCVVEVTSSCYRTAIVTDLHPMVNVTIRIY